MRGRESKPGGFLETRVFGFRVSNLRNLGLNPRVYITTSSFFNEFDRVRSFTTARPFEWTPRHFRTPCTDRASPRFNSLNVGSPEGLNAVPFARTPARLLR